MNRSLSFESLWSRRGLLAIGAVAFFATLAATIPASALLSASGIERRGVSYTKVQGSLWRGEITGLSVRGVHLGSVRYKLHLSALLRGRLEARLNAGGGDITGEGVASAGLGGAVSLRNARFDVDLSAMRGFGFLGYPLEGAARADIRVLEVSKRGCRRADADVWTDALTGPARRMNGQGFAMSGKAACAGDDLVIDLAGSGDEGDATLRLSLAPDLAYELAASANPAQPELARALGLFGFEERDGSLVYASTGAFKIAGS